MFGLFDGTPLERPVTCDDCGQQLSSCSCKPTAQEESPDPSQQHVRVRRERRRGKWCTIVTEVAPGSVKPLLKQLRSELGVGGGESHGDLVLQGDHRDKVTSRLVELGYPAKSAGG